MTETALGRRERSVLFVAFAVAIVVRLGLFGVVAGHPSRFSSPDTTQYVAVATHLHAAFLDGTHSRWFDLGLRRTPAYPVLLAAIYAVSGRHDAAVALVQIACSVATIALVFALGRRLLGPAAGAWAALALALDPMSIVMTDYLQPEVVFTLLLVAGALVWVRSLQERSWRLALGAGALFGLAALTRPIVVYLPVVLVPVSVAVLVRGRARWVAVTVAVVVGFLVPVGGWMARNAATTGVPLVSTIEGTNALLYRAAPALARDTGISLAEARARLTRDLNRRVGPHANVAEVSRAATSLSITTLLHHPKGTVITDAKGLGTLLVGPGRAELLRLLGRDHGHRAHTTVSRGLVGLAAIVYGLIALAAVAGLVVVVRRRDWLTLLVAGGLILYFLAFSAGADAYSRLRVPIMPFVALFAGAALAAGAEWRRPAAPASADLPDAPRQTESAARVASPARDPGL
jgi:4-amino-4-deoxy-L-arabinose transferase-like glycosyltransferase